MKNESFHYHMKVAAAWIADDRDGACRAEFGGASGGSGEESSVVSQQSAVGGRQFFSY